LNSTVNNLIAFLRRIKNILLFFYFLGVLFSILANFVSPMTSVVIASFGLLFIPLFFGNLIILILYIKRDKTTALVSFLLLIISLKYAPRTMTYHSSQEKKGLKVMTWNVKNFDLYNWSKNAETRQNMANLIDTISPDVLCMQEFFTNNSELNNIELLKSKGLKYYSFYPSYSQKNKGNKWGLAIFSKYPMKNAKLIDINPQNSAMNQCMSAEIQFKDKNYKIYNAHFQSIHLDYDDYGYLENVKKKWNMLNYLNTWQIVYKITKAFKNRTNQVEAFLDKYNQTDNMSSILCCDMNDVPNSYSYCRISSVLTDAFTQKGKFLSNTISIFFPLYRIDYVFCSKDIKVNSYKRIETNLSDHHIVTAYLD